jgi:hypothetical protein
MLCAAFLKAANLERAPPSTPHHHCFSSHIPADKLKADRSTIFAFSFPLLTAGNVWLDIVHSQYSPPTASVAFGQGAVHETGNSIGLRRPIYLQEHQKGHCPLAQQFLSSWYEDPELQ